VVGARLPAAGPRRPSCGGPSLVRRRRTIKGLFNRRRLLQPPSSYWLRLAALARACPQAALHVRPRAAAVPLLACWILLLAAAGCCCDGEMAQQRQRLAGWLLLLGTESDSDSAKVAPPLISCVFRSQPKVRRLAGRSYSCMGQAKVQRAQIGPYFLTGLTKTLHTTRTGPRQPTVRTSDAHL
jgi:hypothetical protein